MGVYPDTTCGGAQNACNQVDQGAFSGTVVTNHADNLPGMHLKIGTTKSPKLARSQTIADFLAGKLSYYVLICIAKTKLRVSTKSLR
jgi:hypothetical protein